MLIREYRSNDEVAVNSVALAAFEQYRELCSDWTSFVAQVGQMACLADAAELVVAEVHGRLSGAVVYFGPERPKPSLFEPQWAWMRMLVVDPAARRSGIGRALARECVRRAARDRAIAIAAHTSALMEVAEAMVMRLGFELHTETASFFGIPHNLYLKRLAAP